MASYLILLNYTQEGVAQMKRSPERLEKAREVFKSKSCELREFYLAMGRYDAVVIVDGPNDEAVMQAMLVIAGAGAVRSETLRLFNEQAYHEIIASLS